MKLQRRQPEPPSQHLRQSPPPPPFASTPQRHHASHATNTTETTWTVRQLVYVAAWCFIVFCSTTLSVVADVFLDDAPAFPLLPTVVVATCAAAAAAYISALLGCCVHPAGSFQLYQPFAGGARFVTIQAFGYYILTTSQVVVLSFATGFDPNVSATHGLISITGLAALVANIMILASIFTFDPAEAKGQADHHGLVIDLLEKVSKSPNRETTLVTIFTIAQLGLCCVGEQFSWVGNVSALVVGAFHAINGYIMHFVVGYRFTPGYRLFMPCPGTKSQALAQGAAWLVYFVTLYGAGFLWYVGEAAPPIAHVALGSGCLLSSVGLILFTRLAKFHTEPAYDSVTSYGCIVLTITSTLFASVVVLLSALLMLTEVETHIRYGLEFCQMLSSFFILIITPCTNMLGKVLHGPSFHLFQPFKGGMDFVMLQAAGWACYGFALLFQTLQLSSSTNSDGTAPGTYHWIFLEAVLALMAQVFVHSSLRTFRADATDAKAHSDSPHHEVNGLRKILTVVVNGELVTAFLCAACALALRIVVDVAELRWDQTPFPRTAVLLLAVLLYACATPLAHLSGRHYGIPLFRPFDGSGMYVALQSIGWTIYALSLLMILVSWIVRDGSYDVSGGPSHLVNQRPMFVATSFGVAQFIPLVLVSISVVVESIQVSRAQKTKGFATQAFEAILRAEQVLLKADHATDVDRRRELDALIQELRTTSMSLRISASPARERFPSPAKSSATSTIEQDTDEDSTDDASRHFAVAIIIVLMSMASLAAYVSGAFWTTVMPLYGVGCATAALAIVTTSCVALHTGYGYSLHGHSGRYTYLMPFVGGTPFVLRQALGWMSYTVCAVLTIAVAIERRSNPVALVLAGVASVVAQFSLLESIPCFDAKSFQHKRKTFLQSNSAALVATFTFLGSFVFAHLYGRFREQTFGVEEHDDGDATLRVARAHMVPLVVTGVSMTFAIPLTLMALRARMTNLEGSETSDGDNAADHPLSHLGVKRRLLRDILLAVDSIVFALSLSIPAGILYIAYFLLHSLSASTRNHMSFNLTSLAHSWGIIMLVIGTLLAFSLAFPVI
ncbi:diacylglycerol acyltransferase, putative, partial [Bodo saltans]